MRTLNDYFITVRLADISATGGVAYVAIPDGGRVIKIHAVQEGAITGADAAITFFTKQGGSTVMRCKNINTISSKLSNRRRLYKSSNRRSFNRSLSFKLYFCY